MERKNHKAPFKTYQPQKGHPDWADIFSRAEDLVKKSEEVLNLGPATLTETLRELQRKSDALLNHGRTFMENRSRLEKGSETFLPSFVIWTMHNTCNFRCNYCDNHQGEAYFRLSNQGRLDTEKGRELLQRLEPTTRGIYFCGGEPTLRQDLAELTDFAHGKKFFPLMINTNGSQIHKILLKPEYKNWLRQMDVIIVSLDALSLPVLEKSWGVKKETCEQVFVNLVALWMLKKRVPFKLVVNTVITEDTLGEISSVMDFARDMGIWFSPVPENEGMGLNRELLDNPEYKKLVQKILSAKDKGGKILGSRNLLERLLKGRPLKCHPTLKPHVDIDGNLYWPCKTLSQIEPLKVNVMGHPSLKETYAEGEQRLNPKGIHGPGPEQCGGDCHWMQNFVSDLYARGLKQPLRSGLIWEAVEFVGVLK